jgi:hypothetical protein
MSTSAPTSPAYIGWLSRAVPIRRIKTRLAHNIAAAAINLIRLDAFWTGGSWQTIDQAAPAT